MTRTPTVVIGTLVYLAVHAGCASGIGGAVELSWRLRPASSSLPDKFLDCQAASTSDRGSVTRIRLDWQVAEHSGTDAWSCTDNQGLTGFDLPPGIATLTIRPECEDKPALASTYIAPPPIQREAIAGQTITLGAMELVLQVDRCGDQPCICQ